MNKLRERGFMKTIKLIPLLMILFFGLTSFARMEKLDPLYGNPYITLLSEAGKNQLNYKEFKAILENLKTENYTMMLNSMGFYVEILEKYNEGERVNNRLEFAIEVYFTGKIIETDGVKLLKVPTIRALGEAYQLCDKDHKTCDTPSKVEFTGYSVNWSLVPAGLGGGTSSAGSR